MQQYVILVEKDSQNSLLKIKTIEKLETIAISQVNTEVKHILCNLRFNVPKQFLQVLATCQITINKRVQRSI